MRKAFLPQPIYPTGGWSATVGVKATRLGRFRVDDVDARSFETAYYNAQIHWAAFAAPEFSRKARESWR